MRYTETAKLVQKKSQDIIKSVRQHLSWLVPIVFSLFLLSAPHLRHKLVVAVRLLVEADLPALRNHMLSFGLAAPLVSFFLMLLQAFISPIPSVILFLLNAALYGGPIGMVLSWLSSLASALLCFGLARWLGRPFVSQFVREGFLSRIDDYLYEYGRAAVLFSRVMPFMPFDFTSYAFGLTRTGWWEFTWGTAIGQTPAILFYSFLGHRSLTPLQYALYFGLWILALVLLTPLLGNWLTRKDGSANPMPEKDEAK
ncbi:TVP38/TMEM64 family protein [Heliobacterium gestii]|uniref:TVP38/TMEM64 family membrane protein n=1 Tax=Heliomicrobium gestii TaxID=2699 RepID=A0A845L963_HELGE|nr:TVP38/TMEM64 family protein [Heliomicrobium gestii]MBM7865533.1 putative membrane protein YdjX (TVP38/TMEM64 family) [Heliomicrobium gestii]MZP41784.1 TVP38/TMEM64 family protein [Heliomicrobium gestii]